MIAIKMTTPFSILRTVWGVQSVGGKDVDIADEQTVGTFNGYIQQATPEYAQYMGINVAKGHSVWCPLSTQVSEGDTISADGVQYQVRARIDYRDGDNPHAQLAVEMIGTDPVIS
jgi:hypothetical protein